LLRKSLNLLSRITRWSPTRPSRNWMTIECDAGPPVDVHCPRHHCVSETCRPSECRCRRRRSAVAACCPRR
jgi:hypothetical protein